MLQKIIGFLNIIFFKRERVVVQTFPNFEDNGVALANYIALNYDMPIFFINRTNKYSNYLEANLDVVLLSARSFRSIYYLITSKYIFFTHGSVIKKFSKRQVAVNLWHGYGYKPVGVLIGNEGIYSNYTAATSLDCQKTFSKMFDVSKESVLITGFPRNDRLFDIDKEFVFNALNLDFKKKIFFWLPTYRKSVIGEFRDDGVYTGNSFGIKDFDDKKFDLFMKNNNAICIIKPHPMAPKYLGDGCYENIKFVDDDFLHDKGLTLYPLLGAVDCLISDLSSVIVDYTLVDKPIICFLEDLDEYRNTRGLLFDDFEEYVPGPIAENTDDFYVFLKDVIENKDSHVAKRNSLKEFFHQFRDGNSSQRIAEHVFNKICKIAN